MPEPSLPRDWGGVESRPYALGRNQWHMFGTGVGWVVDPAMRCPHREAL